MNVFGIELEPKDAILTYATFFGPIISAIVAVYITRYVDANKIDKERKLDILRHLMKTRNIRLHPDHVMSLNLVPLVFSNDPKVIEKFKNYIEHLYTKIPNDQDEGVRFEKKRDLLFWGLISAIAKSLGVEIEPQEAEHFGYVPNGWTTTENEQAQLRKLLIAVLGGNAAISVRPAPQERLTPTQLFPPPPSE